MCCLLFRGFPKTAVLFLVGVALVAEWVPRCVPAGVGKASPLRNENAMAAKKGKGPTSLVSQPRSSLVDGRFETFQKTQRQGCVGCYPPKC